MAVTRRGKHKVTIGQHKKHVSQMSIAEKQHLLEWVADSWSKNPKLKPNEHLRDKIKRKQVKYSPELARNALQNLYDCLIEFNYKTCYGGRQEPRIVVRSKEAYKIQNKWYHQVIVLDLCNMEVITAYSCLVTDTHRHLDMKRYNESIEIMKELYV